jgi:hypothetical protein
MPTDAIYQLVRGDLSDENTSTYQVMPVVVYANHGLMSRDALPDFPKPAQEVE